MSDGTWEDYVDLSGVDPHDPSQAVPEINAQVTDFAATADTAGAVSDLDQVALDTAAHQSDLAVDQQSWADWNGDIAASASTDAQAYVDDASAALATGDVAGAEWSLEHAEIYAATAADASETAAGFETTTADYLTATEGSLDSVDYSGVDASASTATTYDATTYDATTYDTTSYDATSYDSSIDY